MVVALLVSGAASRATLARPLYLAVGLIFGLALFSAISSFWSGSAELSAIEADRALAYLGFFLAAFLIAQTDLRRQRFAEGVAIGVALVALLGLASRLLPDLMQVSDSLLAGTRLRYPLGYWNANGILFGIAATMLLWMSRRAAWPALRWVAAGATPAVLLALYFCFSRGGLLALTVSALCLLALSRDRLWLLATLALGALGALPAVLAVQARDALTYGATDGVAADQGLEVLAILAAGTALTLLLYAGLRRLEARQGAATGRMLELSQSPKVLKGIAAAGAVLAIAAVAAVGGRAWDQFTSTDIQFPSTPQEHFGNLSGAGRGDFWRVAIDSLGDQPVRGIGAGSYEFAWERDRSIEQPVHDAHSLYLESFAELGILGGLLVLALIGSLLWIGFCAWRGAPHPQRDRYAALLAAMLAFAVGAALDWFWEIAVVGAVFFLAAGVLVAARCRQLAQGRPFGERAREDRGFGLAVVGLAAAWLAAVALIGPLLVDRELSASRDAAARGEIANAIEHADTARSIEPFAASPYVQLALLAELERDYPAAAERLTQAIDREDRNWQLYYLRSRVEGAAGDANAARADLERARRLNPLEDCLDQAAGCG